jgi:hypothetical protein
MASKKRKLPKISDFFPYWHTAYTFTINRRLKHKETKLITELTFLLAFINFVGGTVAWLNGPISLGISRFPFLDIVVTSLIYGSVQDGAINSILPGVLGIHRGPDFLYSNPKKED